MNDQLFSVKDQVVLVSGGSRGIGRGIAEGFAQRGARVIITGRQQSTLDAAAKEMATTGAEVKPIVCDVSDRDAVQRLVDQVIHDFGQIDTLINVAGVNRRMLAEELTMEDYDFIMDINLNGAFALSLAAGRHMLKRGKGSQINIVSLNNDRPLKGVAPYAISKAGMGQMTRALAMEWGDRGVRVNAIAPGFILTDLTQKLWAQPTMREWGLTNTPLKRLGQVSDMVGTAIYLASEASAFMTGQTLFVDGGMSAGLNWPIDFNSQ